MEFRVRGTVKIPDKLLEHRERIVEALGQSIVLQKQTLAAVTKPPRPSGLRGKQLVVAWLLGFGTAAEVALLVWLFFR